MVYQKKIQKWATSVGLPDDFWVNADSAPLKEFLSKLLSSEILRTAPDIVVTETIPFEKLLSIGQYKLGIHACLVGSDLFSMDSNLKLGLFATIISLKSALSDFKSETLLQLPSPDFGIAGGTYNNKAICQKCNRPILYIERIIVAERAFHRGCMHCYLCGKRLFLGMFRIVGDHLECFEHLLNKFISGNELLPFENAKAIKSPPPRPPPPTRKSIQLTEEPKISPVIEQQPIETIEKQQTPPSTKKSIEIVEKQPSSSPTKKHMMASPGQQKALNDGSDHSGDGTWEEVEYPEQLNPFSEDDIDNLSDNLSSLNPFGDSSDEESDVEPVKLPVAAPRKLKTPSHDGDVVKESALIEVKPEPKVLEVKTEPEVLEVKPEPEVLEVKPETIVIKEPVMYPDLKRLFVDTETETMFNFYLPSSLALYKKRLIDLCEFDRPKLLHELDKVIKTLDYIEKSAKECERSLLKEVSKEDFKWDKSPLVDEFGKSMKMKHENLIKGSMIVHEYLKKLLEKAINKIDQIEGNQEFRAQLLQLQAKLKFEHSAIPTVMEDLPPKPKDSAKKKGLVKRIKKVL